MSIEEEPIIDDVSEAVPIEISAARGALASRDFRVLLLGALASSVGTWMQTATLGAFAYRLTGSPIYVGIVYVAQLGPILFLSPFAGLWADAHDRRKIILRCQVGQLLASLALAVVALHDRPNRVLLATIVLVLGITVALNVPAWFSLIVTLVPPQHLAGAISLNATQINVCRVIGPVIGAFVYKQWGAAPVFFFNAVTYLFVIGAVLAIHSPPTTHLRSAAGGWRRFVEGVEAIRADDVLRRAILTVSLLSLFCLQFLSQLPTIAHDVLGIDPKSLGYGVFYGCLGIGTVAGALAVGTVLSRRDHRRMVVTGFAVLAATLFAFAPLRQATLAFPLAVVLGSVYFAITTWLTTMVQAQTPDHLRGRVSAIFNAAWAGVVPIGGLLGGIVAQAISIRFVLVYGGVAAVLLALYARRIRPSEQ